jgi:HIT domain
MSAYSAPERATFFHSLHFLHKTEVIWNGQGAVGRSCMARAPRRSYMRCEGINVFLCDGEVAFQTVFHFHLHVIPRYEGDGWTIIPESAERERSLLDSDAQAIKDAIAATD